MTRLYSFCFRYNLNIVSTVLFILMVDNPWRFRVITIVKFVRSNEKGLEIPEQIPRKQISLRLNLPKEWKSWVIERGERGESRVQWQSSADKAYWHRSQAKKKSRSLRRSSGVTWTVSEVKCNNQQMYLIVQCIKGVHIIIVHFGKVRKVII